MFRQLKKDQTDITIYINDQAVPAKTGELVAAVLLRQGIISCHKSPKNDQRGPYCMMGVWAWLAQTLLRLMVAVMPPPDTDAMFSLKW